MGRKKNFNECTNRFLEKSFKALANSRRLEIIHLLNTAGPLSVLELSRRMKLSFRSVSKHLGVLNKSGITRGDRGGMSVYYLLNSNLNYPIKDFVAVVCRECAKQK